MKNKTCILVVFIFYSLQGESQNKEDKQVYCLHDYKLDVEVPIYACTITGQVIDTALMVAVPGALFTIVKSTCEDSLVIRFWEWKENKAMTLHMCYADSLRLVRKYFLVSKKDLAGRTNERFRHVTGFNVSSVLIPFKLRLQKFDFSKDVTLGPAAGVRFRLSSYSPDYVNVLLGIGITSVTIDSGSTNGYTETSFETSALTPSIGFVFELSNTLQAGMFCGWDYIAHNDALHFIYHGKTWISFGVGISLVSTNENDMAGMDRNKH